MGPHHQSGVILYLHTSACSKVCDLAKLIGEALLKTLHSVNIIHQLSVSNDLMTALKQLYGIDTVNICIKLEAEAFGCVASS